MSVVKHNISLFHSVSIHEVNSFEELSFKGSPTGHCLASVESGAPNHDGLIGRTDTANSDGRGWGWGCVFASVSVCARVCVHACMRDVFAIYDTDILPRLIMIIIKIIIQYFIQIRHTDDFS